MEKALNYRVQYYLKFQASTGSLGMYSLQLSGVGGGKCIMNLKDIIGNPWSLIFYVTCLLLLI
jgi:hypothetical protein